MSRRAARTARQRDTSVGRTVFCCGVALASIALLVVACSPESSAPRDRGDTDQGDTQDTDGDDDSGGNDDDGAIPPLVTVDWRTVRGPPLAYIVTAEVAGEPFALTSTGFATRGPCVGDLCTLTWYDDAGNVLRQHTDLVPGATDWVSTDGELFAAVEVTASSVCDPTGIALPTFEGTWGLYSVATGERLVEVSPVSVDPSFPESTFTRHGTIVRVDRVEPTSCAVDVREARRTVAPYASPTGLSGLDSPYVEDDTADGQLIVSSRSGLRMELGVVRSDVGDSYVVIEPDFREWASAHGYVHAVAEYPFQRIATFTVATRGVDTLAVAFDEEDFTRSTASLHWVAVCSDDATPRCDLHDTRTRAVRRVDLGPRRVAVLAGASDLLMLDVEGGHLTLLDLRNGAGTQLAGIDTAYAVGERAFVATNSDTAFAVTRDVVASIAERPRDVLRGATQVVQPQSDVVFVVSSNPSGSQTRLHAWNVKTNVLAHLTDDLNYNPPFGRPFTADTMCAAPGFVRSAGPPQASAAQPGRWLHFTEFVPDVEPKLRLYIVPADLSASPRLFAELVPDGCAPPLVDASDTRFWVPVPSSTAGVRAIFASWD